MDNDKQALETCRSQSCIKANIVKYQIGLDRPENVTDAWQKVQKAVNTLNHLVWFSLNFPMVLTKKTCNIKGQYFTDLVPLV